MSRSLSVLLLLAASTLTLPAASQDLPNRLPWESGWAVADFNGDRHADLATDSSGRHDAQGYAHEVRVNLSAAEHSSLLFRSPYAKVGLSARDMDGDRDSDIVIVEASSREPLAIWLNDGSGHFQEGDLADYQAILARRDPASYESPELQTIGLPAVSEERPLPSVPSVSTAPRLRLVQSLPSEREQTLADFHLSNLRARAPPAHS